MEDQPIDRDQLALDTFNGVLPFLMAYLEYLDGYEMDGQWFPANGMDLARCLQLVQGFSDEQLKALVWRGLTLPPARYFEHNPLDLPVGVIHEGNARAVILIEAHRERMLYDLIDDDDALLRLRPGERELVEAADFPDTIDGVLAVLWRRIAPADPVEQAPGA